MTLPPGALTDEQASTRARIARALIDVVGERGFRNTTVEAICERAAVERTDFEYLFDDLADCFCQVFADLGGEFLQRILAVFTRHERWRDQLRAVAYEFLAYLQEDPARARLTVLEVLFAGEQAQILRDQVFAGLFALIDLGRQEMEDPESLTPATSEAVGGAIFTQMRLAVENGSLDELTDLVPKMMYQAVLPYLGPAAALEELQPPPPTRVAVQ